MPRPRKHDDDALVAAAARAIGRRGPFALTLADVAAEAGVSAATLVGRFGSKRDLLLAVAAAGADGVTAAFASARDGRAPLFALERALGELAAGAGDPDQAANHLAFLALDLTDPEFRERTAAHFGALRDAVAATLDAAADAGELPPRARRTLTDAVVAAYHGTLLTWAIDREGTAPERVRAAVRALLRPYRT